MVLWKSSSRYPTQKEPVVPRTETKQPARLKGNESIAFRNQAVQVDLLGPLVVRCLHAVKVKELSSGEKHTFGQGK